MAIGNTFGATVLSSYGGFWMSLAITFIPGGFNIMGALEEADGGSPFMFYNSFALYLMVRIILPFQFLSSQRPRQILILVPPLGLVYLYNHYNVLNPQINRRLLLPLLLCRPRYLDDRTRILLSNRRIAKCQFT